MHVFRDYYQRSDAKYSLDPNSVLRSCFATSAALSIFLFTIGARLSPIPKPSDLSRANRF